MGIYYNTISRQGNVRPEADAFVSFDSCDAVSLELDQRQLKKHDRPAADGIYPTRHATGTALYNTPSRPPKAVVYLL